MDTKLLAARTPSTRGPYHCLYYNIVHGKTIEQNGPLQCHEKQKTEKKILRYVQYHTAKYSYMVVWLFLFFFFYYTQFKPGIKM